jgi:phosphonate transport system substrate-binding protein
MKFASELFSVCPHDTAKNQIGWFLINTYLQRRLGCRLHFEPQNNFLVERQAVLDNPGFRLVYANPFSAAIFRKRKGYLPVARPVGVFDETILAMAAERETWPAQPKIASATDKLIIHTLGLTLLPQVGIERSHCEFVFTGNHAAAGQAVIQGKADLAFIFNETWHGLGESTRKQLKLVAETTSRTAYHCFCIAPEWADKLPQLQEILCSMHESEEGRRVLADLHFKGFEPANADDIDLLIMYMETLGF